MRWNKEGSGRKYKIQLEMVIRKQFKVQALIAKIILLLGILLLLYMVVVEDEPGAIPLLLVAAGLFIIFLIKYKKRKAQPAEKGHKN
jgi:hypothetical protein